MFAVNFLIDVSIGGVPNQPPPTRICLPNRDFVARCSDVIGPPQPPRLAAQHRPLFAAFNFKIADGGVCLIDDRANNRGGGLPIVLVVAALYASRADNGLSYAR